MQLRSRSKLNITSMRNKLHPDTETGKGKFNEDKFKQITDAYDVLSSKEKRALYDGARHPQEVSKRWGTTMYDDFRSSTQNPSSGGTFVLIVV